MLCGKKGIKVANQLPLRVGMNLDSPGEAHVIPRVLTRGQGRKESQRQRDVTWRVDRHGWLRRWTRTTGQEMWGTLRKLDKARRPSLLNSFPADKLILKK